MRTLLQVSHHAVPGTPAAGGTVDVITPTGASGRTPGEQPAEYLLLRPQQADSQDFFDRRGHIIAQFLGSLQRSFYPHKLQFASRDLPRGLVVAERGV